MPFQDHLWAAWTPKTWNEMKQCLEELGVKDVPDSSVSQAERFEWFGGLDKITTLKIEGITYSERKLPDLEVVAYIPSMDSDNEESFVDTVKETGKLWCCIGIELTSRYAPSILDQGMPHGREDYFEIDVPKAMKVVGALSKLLQRQASLTLIGQHH